MSLENLKIRDIVDRIVNLENDLPIIKIISDNFGEEKPEYKTCYESKLSELKSLYQEIDKRN